MISIVACYHSAKLCAHAARAFRSQQYEIIDEMGNAQHDCDQRYNAVLIVTTKHLEIMLLVINSVHDTGLKHCVSPSEQFEFETPGVWPICVIKKTLKLDFFSSEV